MNSTDTAALHAGLPHRYLPSDSAAPWRPIDPPSQETARALYRSMLRIRMIECEIERQYSQDQMKTPIHLVIGQEAAAVGACAGLRSEDRAWGTHRTHGLYLAKGGDLKAMLAEMFCKITGCVGSRGGSMHLVDFAVGMMGTSAIVGGILPISAGAALASQMRKDGLVHLVFFGDAANEEGATLETYNFAALKKLPLIFFCENNYYSVCSPLHYRQPPVEIWRRAAAFGMESLSVDGTRVEEVRDATRYAAELARAGRGPVFIEAKVCRYRAHGGAGDDSKTGYRDVAEVAHWSSIADPIQGYESILSSRGLWTSEWKLRLEAEITAEMTEAFSYAVAAPVPTAADLHRFAYA